MEPITVKATVSADLQTVWEHWTQPEHITHWNFASDDWHCPSAVNDLKPRGAFSWRMEAKDGSFAFDYKGVYEQIVDMGKIEKELEDGRKVVITFSERDGATEVVETFDPENQNPRELQEQGWQAILNNFKKYVESK